MDIEEIEEYRLLVKRPDEKRWKWNGSSVIRSRSAAQARVKRYQDEYGPTGWEFKFQVRTVKIESTPWKDPS